jgi:hypothetical protein
MIGNRGFALPIKLGRKPEHQGQGLTGTNLVAARPLLYWNPTSFSHCGIPEQEESQSVCQSQNEKE